MILLTASKQHNSLKSAALFGLHGGLAVSVGLVVVWERGKCKERLRFARIYIKLTHAIHLKANVSNIGVLCQQRDYVDL